MGEAFAHFQPLGKIPKNMDILNILGKEAETMGAVTLRTEFRVTLQNLNRVLTGFLELSSKLFANEVFSLSLPPMVLK